MHSSFKNHKHTWIITIVAISLALLLLFLLPDKKAYSMLVLGLAGGHLILGLFAAFTGWMLISHKNITKIFHRITKRPLPTDKADYGQDMPGIVITAVIMGFVFTILAIFLYHLTQNLLYIFGFGTLAVFLFTISMVGFWSSRHGKLKLRDKVLGCLSFKGSENILDIGCGNGLLLIEAAKRAPFGKATGGDTWDKTLEYSYTAQKALSNAKIEGVENRVSITTADVQAMPFETNYYDIVMTSLMMHHVPDTKKALKEMVRVTKPGGTIVIADVKSKRFIPMLKSLNFAKVEALYATRLFFMPAYVILAVKPSNLN